MKGIASYTLLFLVSLAGCTPNPLGPGPRTYHVAITGDDANSGSMASPLRTISAAAKLARPGEVITVHEGVYRERVTPPRGGESDSKRITYQAAPGEKVIVTGSEPVKGWDNVSDDTWKVVIPNSFFGAYNPYGELIHGDWFSPQGRQHHTGSVYLNGQWLIEAAGQDDVLKPAGDRPLWFAVVDGANTTLWAQFKGVDPNESLVEINVRPTVFTPEKTGINYLTVRGFTMRHAATNWAPPTAGQFGLISAYWCKGWIIENNEISYSKCSGIALGKHGDEFDNTSADSAEGYVETIKRAYQNGWTRENIGHHIVRNNHVHHCEQAGIVGSMGSAFCSVTGNDIHDIYVLKLFSGAEMAGIKFHAAVDTEISGNHIHHNGGLGMWLDWMAQGTRVTRNFMHDNGWSDLFVEVNHGPFLVANNLFLSARSIDNTSNGGAYVHNLSAAGINVFPENNRDTPCLRPHDTVTLRLHKTEVGDDRWFNNLVIGNGDLTAYDGAKLPVMMDGNVFLQGAKPSKHERRPLVQADFDPVLKLSRRTDGSWQLDISLDPAWAGTRTRPLVTTGLLGRAKLPDQAYELPDGSSMRIDADYFGRKRNAGNPFPGPFENPAGGKQTFKVWPVATPELK